MAGVTDIEPRTRTENVRTWKRERRYYRLVLCLSLDTSTPGGSCAVTRDGILVRELSGDPNRPHDARLPGDLMALVEDARIDLREIDLYSVATGPGSFTGLRIGIATMQGLAFAVGKPLIGVSGFEALAAHAIHPPPSATPHHPPRTPLIATWVDAWRGEVYAALYESEREVEPPTVRLPTDL